MPALSRAFIAILSFGLLVACQEDGPEPINVGFEGGEFGEVLLATQKAECQKDGGQWGRGGPGGTFVCYTPMRDSGKSCTRGTDCQGLCLARSRTCAPVDPFIGCHEVLTNGGLRATVCVE